MGREIRRVPPNWEHPKNTHGNYQPMYDQSADERYAEWLDDFERFKTDEIEKACKEHGYDINSPYAAFCEYDGGPPDYWYYRPAWDESRATWWQVYETVSEGTPVTPPFETPEELVDYLVANGDFWDQSRRAERERGKPCFMNCEPWARETAEKFVKTGWAMSFVADSKGLRSGVDALADGAA